MTPGVTIGQAAAFAGVTIKTVRHYHRLGLAPEPSRDHSGYRRYTSADLLRLTQIKTLAGAGVPLARINDLLDADAPTFARHVDDVAQDLDARIDELRRRRATLRRLTTDDRMLLPDHACAVLDHLLALGLDPTFVDAQREGLVLARAVAPDLFDTYVTQLELRLSDPDHVALLKRSWDAEGWPTDDPRLDDLAKAMAANLLTHPEWLRPPPPAVTGADAALRYDLVNHHRHDDWPTSSHLTTLVEAHLRAAGVEIRDCCTSR